MSKYKIKKTSVETRLAIERRSAAMLPDRPTQAGFKPWDIRNALFSAIIADKGACLMGEIDRIVDEANEAIDAIMELVGGTASGVDETAVREIITTMLGKVANERQYSVTNPPPYPVTKVNGKTGEVGLSAEDVGARPASWTPTPADIGAEINGTASALLKLHDVNEEAHGGALAQIPILQNLLTTVIGTDTGKSMRAVAALVIAESLKNASSSMDTLEEMAAWIEAHPADVAALVARIVKLEAEIVTKIAVKSIVNNLTTNDATKPLSAAQGYALKALLDALTTTVDGKTTPSQVQDAISKALVDYAKAVHNHDDVYAPKSHDHAGVYQPAGSYADADHNHDGTYAKPADIPTKLSQLTGDSTHRTVTDTEKTGWNGKADGDHNHDGKYQPAGNYAPTDHNHDGAYQPKGNYLTQHQSLAHLLPKNQGAENAGKLMAVAADGSVAYIPVSDLGVSGDLVGNFADDGSIVLITPLDVGVYDLYTEDGRLYGKMTVEAAKAKYTVTFMADGTIVKVVEYTEGDTTLTGVPTVPAKDGYTGVWESYTLDNSNITVDAVYTAIPVEPEFTNLIDEAGYTMGKRISNSENGETSATKTIVLTGPLEVEKYGDVFHVRGVDSLTPPSDGTGDYAGKYSCWDTNKTFIAGTLKSFPASCVGTDANGDFTLTYTSDWGAASGTVYVRLQFYDADGSVPSLIVTRNELIPK